MGLDNNLCGADLKLICIFWRSLDWSLYGHMHELIIPFFWMILMSLMDYVL